MEPCEACFNLDIGDDELLLTPPNCVDLDSDDEVDVENTDEELSIVIFHDRSVTVS